VSAGARPDRGQELDPKDWRVRGYPTLFLIDAKGVIRKTWLGGPSEEELDREVDLLVKEAKAAK